MTLINPEQIRGGGAGGGITSDQHERIRQLIHFLDEGPGHGIISGAYKETLPAGSIFPDSIIWYADINKTQKIVDKLIIWNGIVPSDIIWHMYDVDGITVIQTVADAIFYTNNIFEVSRIRSIF